MDHEPHEPTIRRRRKITRSMREKTPDPNFAPTIRRKLSEPEDDNSSYLDGGTTASAEEQQPQIISMQIRPPSSAMSAHQSKILRRRDKTFASTAARSLSQPRQAERLSSPEAHDLITTAAAAVTKRSLSTPRHKDESSESEMVQAKPKAKQEPETLRPTVRSTAPRLSPIISETPAATADENLSRLELNLRRFEEERQRLEFEKRLFEREKREHRARHKQLLDNEERKRLLQNYRKLSDRIQLPTDAEERRRMVHSLRLNRNEAPQLRPKTARNPAAYDESSTQFSSSDADADDSRLIKQLSPTRRNAPVKIDNICAIRGPPPQPPQRSSVSRNNSLSPIRPQRRSKTPEQQRALANQKMSSNGNGVLPAQDKLSSRKSSFEKEKITPPRSSLEKLPSVENNGKNVVVRRRSQRKDSLTGEPMRRQSLESADKMPRRKRSLEKPAIPKDTVDDASCQQLKEVKIETHQNWREKLIELFKRKTHSPFEKSGGQDAAKQPTLPISLYRQFRRDASEQWQFLMLKYPEELAEFRRLRRKCIGHTILLIMICGFGGLMFRYTEGSSENIYKCEVRKVKRDFIDNLWTVSHSMREDDWKSLARQKLRKFEEELNVLLELGIRRTPGAKSWNFVNCIIYCWTVISTIGARYGHITPKTKLGEFLTIIYAIIGIPLFLILLTDFGKLFTRGLKILWAFVRRLYYTGTCRRIRKQQQIRDTISGFNTVYDFTIRRPSHFFGVDDSEADAESQGAGTEKSVNVTSATGSHLETPTSPIPETFEIDDNFNLPISVATTILIAYMLIGGFIYTMWEDWSYFEAIYFIFISMSTIGFGDIVPQNPIFMMCSIVYLVFGLALTAMFINVMQIKLSDTFKSASTKISATIGMASEADDETCTQSKTPSEIASIHGSGGGGARAKVPAENIENAAPLHSILRAPRAVASGPSEQNNDIKAT